MEEMLYGFFSRCRSFSSWWQLAFPLLLTTAINFLCFSSNEIGLLQCLSLALALSLLSTLMQKMKLSRKKESAFVVFISKRPGSYAIYRRSTWVLEMQHLIPAFMKRWTYVRTTPYRRFSQNQNFLDVQITKFSYPIVLRCAREISARTQKVDKTFRKPRIQSDTLTSQHSHTPLCLCVVKPRLYGEKLSLNSLDKS